MSSYHSVQMSTQHWTRLGCMCWHQTVPNRYIEAEFDVGYFQLCVHKEEEQLIEKIGCAQDVSISFESSSHHKTISFFQFHSKWEAYLKFCIQTLFFFFFVFNPSSIRCCCCREILWFIWLRVRLMFNESFFAFVCLLVYLTTSLFGGHKKIPT